MIKYDILHANLTFLNPHRLFSVKKAILLPSIGHGG